MATIILQLWLTNKWNVCIDDQKTVTPDEIVSSAETLDHSTEPGEVSTLTALPVDLKSTITPGEIDVTRSGKPSAAPQRLLSRCFFLRLLYLYIRKHKWLA